MTFEHFAKLLQIHFGSRHPDKSIFSEDFLKYLLPISFESSESPDRQRIPNGVRFSSDAGIRQ